MSSVLPGQVDPVRRGDGGPAPRDGSQSGLRVVRCARLSRHWGQGDSRGRAPSIAGAKSILVKHLRSVSVWVDGGRHAARSGGKRKTPLPPKRQRGGGEKALFAKIRLVRFPRYSFLMNDRQ